MNNQLFKEVKHEEFKILFQEELPSYYNGREIPLYLLKIRNYVIIALYLQLFCTLIGFLCFVLRKLIIYLIINLISLICLYIGFQGVLTLDKYKIGIHSVATTSILGIFFLFSVMEALLKELDLDKLHQSERTVMMLLSLPYLMDFFSGCFDFFFLWKLFSQDTMDKKFHNAFFFYFKIKFVQEPKNKEIELQLIDNYDQYISEQSNLCIICTQKEKTKIFYPCGHKICCEECAKTIQQTYNSICPVCRRKITDIIQQY